MSALRLPRLLAQISLTFSRGWSLAASPRATGMLGLHPHYHHHAACHSSCVFWSGSVSPRATVWSASGGFRNTTAAAFSTHSGDTADSEESDEKVKKVKVKVDPRARQTISSVGRKIHHRHLLLLSDEGENLGTHHRADVIRMMEETGKKLVAVNERADPPVFRLMTGKQIHQEQMRLHEKNKNKPAPTKVKELTWSSDIAPADLRTKLRQVASWLDKKHHIRVTLKTGHRGNTPDASQPLDKTLESMLSQMDVPFGFVSPSRAVREGRAASCTIRPPSAKEMRAAAMATGSASGPAAAASTDTPPPPPPPAPPAPAPSSQPSTPAAKESCVDKQTEPH
ncbi:translation initiation factor IF-3, mitochondrial [Engraulis encrasicolus]|uniref:translation initiation factor IF-3, mitochondrial n=1 Tax=Engraulis encrasicolus TaxID=184585 RepID=UPI002FD017EB